MSVWEEILINLRFYITAFDAWEFLELVNLDFTVEVTDVADDSIVLHLLHVLDTYDVDVTSCCNVHITIRKSFFYGCYFVTFHSCL